MSGIVGAALLLISALILGASLRRTERARIEDLRGTVHLLTHARRKIELFSTPADSLFCDFTDGFDSETRRMLSEMPASESLPILARNMAPYGGSLMRFAEEIGTGYRDDAIHLCDYCLECVREELAAAEEAFARRRKLYITLPLLFAISLIVLFI